MRFNFDASILQSCKGITSSTDSSIDSAAGNPDSKSSHAERFPVQSAKPSGMGTNSPQPLLWNINQINGTSSAGKWVPSSPARVLTDQTPNEVTMTKRAGELEINRITYLRVLDSVGHSPIPYHSPLNTRLEKDIQTAKFHTSNKISKYFLPFCRNRAILLRAFFWEF